MRNTLISALLQRKTLGATACAALLAAGCAQLPAGSPSATAWADAQLDSARLAEIDSAVEGAIAEHKLPGAVFRVERNGAVYEKPYGRLSYEPGAAGMTPDTHRADPKIAGGKQRQGAA